MRNKNVGYLVVGISVLIFAIVILFSSGMRSIVSETCSHGPTCSMYDTISFQTYLSLIIAGLVLLIGIFLIFAKEHERVVVKTVKARLQKKKIDLSGLDLSEKKLVGILQREGGAFFQSSLMEELGCGKVKMTRMLDKLEAKQVVERKRRGNNNIVVLKY